MLMEKAVGVRGEPDKAGGAVCRAVGAPGWVWVLSVVGPVSRASWRPCCLPCSGPGAVGPGRGMADGLHTCPPATPREVVLRPSPHR